MISPGRPQRRGPPGEVARSKKTGMNRIGVTTDFSVESRAAFTAAAAAARKFSAGIQLLHASCQLQ